MTEKEFDQRVEAYSQRFERWADDTADRFDQRMTQAWNTSPLFRLLVGGMTTAAGLGMLAGAGRLYRSGYTAAALWSAGIAVAAMAAELVRIVAVGRKR